jgi:hypothetical protein
MGTILSAGGVDRLREVACQGILGNRPDTLASHQKMTNNLL